MQVNNNIYPQPPMQGPAPQGYPQPVTYRPQVPGAYTVPDQYQPGMRPPTGVPTTGAPGAAKPKQEYQYIAQKDVAFGVLGAVGGFFAAGLIGLTGPVGALIFGLGALLLSAITRGIQHNQKQKEQQQQIPPGQMPNAPNYPQPANYQAPQGYQYQNRYNYQNQPMQQPQNYPRQM